MPAIVTVVTEENMHPAKVPWTETAINAYLERVQTRKCGFWTLIAATKIAVVLTYHSGTVPWAV